MCRPHEITAQMPIRLVVDNLACHRGARAIFSGISFALSAGEALVVTGPNGSGKTTLLRTLAGLMVPSEGALRVGDGQTSEEPGTHCHYLGHRDSVRASLTVAENALFWARYLGGSSRAAEAALEQVGLASLADIPAGFLAAGPRGRLARARLLVAWRPVWLLDEPTTSLDAAARTILSELMAAQLAAGGIIVAATHAPLGLANARDLSIGAGALA
jgi:heme exporter protein A